MASGSKVAGITAAVVGAIVLVIVVFQIVGNTAGDLTTSADNISGSGLPLASLFASDGIVLLLFMAGLLLTFVGIFLTMGKIGK